MWLPINSDTKTPSYSSTRVIPNEARQWFRQLVCVLTAGLWLVVGNLVAASGEARPNILFLTCEDLSSHFGSYEGEVAVTPAIDRIAASGVRYDRMFGIDSKCSPNRSAIITGMYPQSIGSQNMRCEIVFPTELAIFPKLLREAGYFTANNYKEDYGFPSPEGSWDQNGKDAHWSHRKPGQPFFAVFNFIDTHEGFVAIKGGGWSQNIKKLAPEEITDPAKITVPPYYPDTPQVREILARSYDNVKLFDRYVAKYVEEIREAGLEEDTIIAVMSDHGDGLLRKKRSMYDSGLQVPFLITIPGKFRQPGQGEPGSSTKELVSMVDLAPTFLRLAGATIPEFIQGRPFLGADRAEPRELIFAGRDRMDERYSLQRVARDHRFKYIRDFRPHQPEFMDLRAPKRGELWKHLYALHRQGKLPESTAAHFEAPAPVERLYDTQADPFELRNLAADPAHAETKTRLAGEMRRWQLEIVDSGMIPEGMLMDLMEPDGIYGKLRSPEYREWVPRALATAELATASTPDMSELLKLTSDPLPPVRYWAIYGLQWNKAADEASVARLKELLSDPVGDVQVAAAAALLSFGKPSEDVVAVLGKAITSKNIGLQLAAGNVVADHGKEMAAILPQIRGAANAKRYGYGASLNTLMNHALDALGKPGIPWGRRGDE